MTEKWYRNNVAFNRRAEGFPSSPAPLEELTDFQYPDEEPGHTPEESVPKEEADQVLDVEAVIAQAKEVGLNDDEIAEVLSDLTRKVNKKG